jgi:hypothetical protein
MRPLCALTLAFVLFWLLPDFRHPLRYSLRAAGIERSRHLSTFNHTRREQ